MYNIILCDDNKEYINFLKEVVLKSGPDGMQVKFYEFLDGESLTEYIEMHDIKFDLLILDMLLPGIDGDEVAHSFRKMFPNAVLVFCSGVMKPTDRSFKTMPYRFLYKEYTMDRMLSEMKEIVNKMLENKVEPIVSPHNYSTIYRLRLDEILYIEAAKRGSRINLCPDAAKEYKVNGDLLSDKKVSEYYEELKGFGFAYAHNSYIVNLKYVRCITGNELEFIRWDNEQFPKRLTVSRTRIKEIKERFIDEMGDKY